MRIVAGKYGGRRLSVPKNNNIRPTSDKIRGAIFNALHSRGAVKDAHVLDAFCGTGALGIEALSRGAAHCTFVDAARASIELTRRNAQDFNIPARDITFIHHSATTLPVRGVGAAAITLAVLDPPYNKGLIAPTLTHLHATQWLAVGAVCVIETDKHDNIALPAPFMLDDARLYGDTRISYVIYNNRALRE